MTLEIKLTVPTREPVRRLELAHWCVEILPSVSYQARYKTRTSSIGFAFDAQIGVHALGTDRRSDFQAVPNGLAFLPPDCDVYSESETGGEYLRISLTGEASINSQSIPFFSNAIDPAAVHAAHCLRRELIRDVETVDLLACEQHLLTLEQLGFVSRRSDVNLPRSDISGKEKYWVSQVLELIESRISTRLTVSEIAAALDLSLGHFNRKFTLSIGVTPHAYIIDRRLAQSRTLLLRSDWDLSAVAQHCGFSSHSHMTAQFHARLGVTPSEYRGNHRP